MENKEEKLKNLIFEVITDIYQARACRQKSRFKLGLATLEILNAEYFQITNKEEISQERLLKLYEELWTF